MNPLPFIPAFLILPVLFSCTQKSNLEIATGKVTTIKLGNVVRIKEINVLTSTDDGTFAQHGRNGGGGHDSRHHRHGDLKTGFRHRLHRGRQGGSPSK